MELIQNIGNPKRTGKKWRSTELLQKLTDYSQKAQKPKKALIPHEQVPDQIIAAELGCRVYELDDNAKYNGLLQHLKAYKSSFMNWDEYAARKMSPEVRSLMKRILDECLRNGFMDMRVEFVDQKEKIVFSQLTEQVHLKPYAECDLCTLCRKNCKWKDQNGVFFSEEILRKKGMPQRCWN